MLGQLIMKQLIECRDYFYIRLKNAYNDDIAKKDVKNLMMILFSLYYLAFIIFVAMLQYKSRIPVPSYLKNNFIVAIVGGAILLSPLYYITQAIMKRLDVVPVDRNMTVQRQRMLGYKVILIYAFGFLLSFVVGWTMQIFFPFLR